MEQVKRIVKTEEPLSGDDCPFVGGAERCTADAANSTATAGCEHTSAAEGSWWQRLWARAKEAAESVHIFAGDKVLWIIIAILLVISVLVVYSSTAKMGYSTYWNRSTAGYLRGHLVMLAMSVVAMIFVYKINCRFLRRITVPAYIVCLLLTIAVYAANADVNGAARWLPIFGFRFQPSEALKIATLMLLSRNLAARQNIIKTLRIVPSLNPMRWSLPEQKAIWRNGTAPLLLPIALSSVIIFPAHTSSAILVFFVSMVMMYVGRVRGRELLKIMGLVVVAGALFTTLNLGRTETAGGRVDTWLELWTSSQQGKNLNSLSDTERAMIAIHDGGILGKGAGRSVMRVEITHPESDYIFAFFVEEYGIILALFMMMLYVWIFFRGIETFKRCDPGFPCFLVLGLTLLITIQAFLHIMVTVNIIPETGQNLPLISHGGSSMLFTSIALGMILAVSRQNEEGSHEKPQLKTTAKEE